MTPSNYTFELAAQLGALAAARVRAGQAGPDLLVRVARDLARIRAHQRFLIPEGFGDVDVDPSAVVRLPFDHVSVEWLDAGAPAIALAEQLEFSVVVSTMRRTRDGRWSGDFAQAEIFRSGVVFNTDDPAEVARTQAGVAVVSQLTRVLACANVTTQLIEPDAAVNRKRVAKGKAPFLSYRVLVLKGGKKSRRVDLGGTHASPRWHCRRGHIRHLSDYREIWINDTVVGNPTRGIALKDYALRPETK